MIRILRSVAFVVGMKATYFVNRDALQEFVTTSERFYLLLLLAGLIGFLVPRGKTLWREFLWICFAYGLITFVFLYINSLLEGYVPYGLLANLAGTLVFCLAGSPVICLALAPAILCSFIVSYFITRLNSYV